MGKAFFLIVDDEVMLAKINARLANRYFLECGRSIEMVVAHSGPEALKIVEEKQSSNPDAEWGLLTDYDMPDMNGGQLIDKLEPILGKKLVMVLVCTGRLDEERKAELEAKPAFVEQKPMDGAALDSYLYVFLMSLT